MVLFFVYFLSRSKFISVEKTNHKINQFKNISLLKLDQILILTKDLPMQIRHIAVISCAVALKLLKYVAPYTLPTKRINPRTERIKFFRV